MWAQKLLSLMSNALQNCSTTSHFSTPALIEKKKIKTKLRTHANIYDLI